MTNVFYFIQKDIQFFEGFPSLSIFSRFYKSDEIGIIMTSSTNLHKLASVGFGMTKKQLCFKSSKFPR